MDIWNKPDALAVDKMILQSTYDCTMNVYGWENADIDEFLEESRVLKYSDVPCGVSYIAAGLAGGGDIAEAETKIKVFCDEELDIAVGNLLEITINGKTIEFRQTGNGKRYLSHQELVAVSIVR